VTSTFERGRKPEREDFFGQTERDDAAAHRENVRIVVLARDPGGVQIVAKRCADAGDLVRGDLLALPAAAKDDATVRLFCGYDSADLRADRRVVDWLFAVRAAIVDVMPELSQRIDQMLLQPEAGVVGANRYAHA
jgi:hypothetical protein